MTAIADVLPRQATSSQLSRYGVTAARIALGLVFTLAGASIFFLIANPPPMPPGLAGTFTSAFFESRWVVFVDLVELTAGLLLLSNRFVPLALVLLGAVLSNILAFHITMQPGTIALPAILTALWFVLAYNRRSQLALLLQK
jgi:putative oxidoreductase